MRRSRTAVCESVCVCWQRQQEQDLHLDKFHTSGLGKSYVGVCEWEKKARSVAAALLFVENGWDTGVDDAGSAAECDRTGRRDKLWMASAAAFRLPRGMLNSRQLPFERQWSSAKEQLTIKQNTYRYRLVLASDLSRLTDR